ncbi:hypothetical protein TcasGA2_TC009005 [Tribolium castaneum]|uniref:Uncharacterized protein n=1 Tax=Tribolium castaneum TaxID=7070 RepID=D6WPX5_TRICA|nr:hypothetical protein TcasGA2_TC009005 [Tribolium castaneum]
MKTVAVFAVLAFIAMAEAKPYFIVRSNDIELPASEKISKREVEDLEESAENEPDSEKLNIIVKRSAEGLYFNVDDLRFRFFRHGLTRERF